MVNNKIVLKDGTVLIDTSADTAEVADVAAGKTFHSKTGEKLIGTSTKDSDTSDGTATASTILNGDVAYSHGNRIVGSMTNNGGVSGSISAKDQMYNVPQGFHDGSGKVGIDSIEKEKIIPTNIRQGVSILGVTGEMSGSEDENPELNKVVTPTFEEQTIIPSGDYTCFKEIKVSAISVEKTANSSGGYTVTIG